MSRARYQGRGIFFASAESGRVQMRRHRRVRTRPFRILIAMLTVFVLAEPVIIAASTQEAGHHSPMDLAAMALLPDLEEAGFEGYVVGVGNLTPWTIEANWLSLAYGVDPATR